MALNINGTTGISGVDGSASAASIAGTDANTGLSFASDTVNINTGGVTRATVDSSGRLLLGTTTEGEVSSDDLTIATAAHTGMTIRSGSSHDGTINFSDGTSGADEYRGWLQYNHTNNAMIIGTDAAERMRIDSSGNIGLGSTNPSGLGYGISILPFNENDTSKIIFNRSPSNYNITVIAFLNGGSTAGSIGMNGSSVSFNTSSDYRLKENVTVISDGITRLKTLKPSRFNFIADATKTVDGFLAHEVTAVPEAITGTKDEVDSDNNPVYQGIDQSKLVPLLTAALQEAVAKIEVLETKVAALEAG